MHSLILALLAWLGFALEIEPLYFLAAYACLVLDVVGLLSGKLRFQLGVVIFYIIGNILANGDFINGLLYGALLGNSIEATIQLGMLLFVAFQKDNN